MRSNTRLVKAIKKTKTSKSGNFRMQVEMNIPELDGFIDAKTYGGVVVQDMVNDIADKWSRGKGLDNKSPSMYNSKRERLRKINNAGYYRNIEDGEEDNYIRAMAYAKKNPDINKKRRKIKSNYRVRAVRAGGRAIRPSKKYGRSPDFIGKTPFYISGSMIDSLKGTFKRARSYTNKSGMRINVSASIMLSVKKSRVKTAFGKAGFDLSYRNKVVNAVNSGFNLNSNYANTRMLQKNLMHWRTLRGGMQAGFILVKVMLKALNWAGRMV